MRFLRLSLLIGILGLQTACYNNSSYLEGIESFNQENYRHAFIRLLPEAAKGRPEAQYAIGYMYYYGQGVTEDRKEAWKWIASAAQAGNKDAIDAMVILKRHYDPNLAH